MCASYYCHNNYSFAPAFNNRNPHKAEQHISVCVCGGGDLQQWERHWAWHWCSPLTQGGAPQLLSFSALILLTNWTCFLGSPNFKLGQSYVPTTGHGMKASAQPPSRFCFRARGFAASKEGLEKTPGSDVVLLWNTPGCPVWRRGRGRSFLRPAALGRARGWSCCSVLTGSSPPLAFLHTHPSTPQSGLTGDASLL